MEEENFDLAMELIAEACELIGWQVAIPNSEAVSYLIIGTGPAVDIITDKLERKVH